MTRTAALAAALLALLAALPAGAASNTALTAGTTVPKASGSHELSPDLFRQVATGVALIKTFGCGGRPIAEGTGFLVGESVVMTARHVLQHACRVHVRVDGDSFTARTWTAWYGDKASVSAADLSTIKLDHAAIGAFIFRVRSSLPPAGTNVSAVGYPLGNRLSLNQGKIIWRGQSRGAPLLAVKMLGAEGASGAPFIDDDGRVVGILQVGLGSVDALGQRTAGVLMGLDLVRWWGPRARLDLCHAYPHGGIAGCPGGTPTPTPTPPGNPAPDPAYTVESCSVQYTAGSWSNVTSPDGAPLFSGAELLANGPNNYWSVVSLASAASKVIHGVIVSLIDPSGLVSSTDPFDWAAGQSQTAEPLGWTIATGGFFFQDPAFPLPQSWTVEWSFPDGELCDAPFSVE
jgi:hypothetical protein